MNRREPLHLTVKKHLSRDVNEQKTELFETGKRVVQEFEIGLHGGAYKKLFGKGFERGHKSQPHKRGIVNVSVEQDGKQRAVYLLFRGANALSITTTEALIHPRTLSRLGIDATEQAHVTVSAAKPVVGRFLHYWQHPDNATRVAFKVGCVGVFLSLLTLVDLFMKWGHKVLTIG
jgi:hypothetical protein